MRLLRTGQSIQYLPKGLAKAGRLHACIWGYGVTKVTFLGMQHGSRCRGCGVCRSVIRAASAVGSLVSGAPQSGAKFPLGVCRSVIGAASAVGSLVSGAPQSGAKFPLGAVVGLWWMHPWV